MSEALRQSFFDTFNRRRQNLQDEWYKYREAQGEKAFALFQVQMSFDNYKLSWQELVRRVSQMTPQMRALYMQFGKIFYGPRPSYNLSGYYDANALKWFRNGTMDAGIQNAMFNFGSGVNRPSNTVTYSHWRPFEQILLETAAQGPFEFTIANTILYRVGSQTFPLTAFKLPVTLFSRSSNSKEAFVSSVRSFFKAYLDFCKISYDATKALPRGLSGEAIPLDRGNLDNTLLGSASYIANSNRIGLTANELRAFVESPDFMTKLEEVLNDFQNTFLSVMADYQFAVTEYVKADQKEKAFIGSFHSSELSFKSWVQSQADMLRSIGVEAIDVDKVIAEVKSQDKPKPQPVVEVAAPPSPKVDSAPVVPTSALPVVNPPAKVIEGKSNNGLLIAGAAVAAIAALTMLG